MTTVTDRYTEEEYFVAICEYLLMVVNLDEDRIEQAAHDIMDCWTFDGVLDTKSLDGIMAAWPTKEDMWFRS